MTDIKKDTLKAQLDDALRQGYDASLMINPELAVVQLNTIMDEQCIKFAEWLDSGKNPYSRIGVDTWLEYIDKPILSTYELLQIFKQENGL